jgi:hypothetical protein
LGSVAAKVTAQMPHASKYELEGEALRQRRRRRSLLYAVVAAMVVVAIVDLFA